MRRAIVTYLRFAVLAAALGMACAPLVARADDNDGTIVIPRPGVEAVSMPTVEAAGLCRHADHAVDLSTGNADISYRLCSLEGEGIEAAVTLRYRTGGVKQEEELGIPGLGWSSDYYPYGILMGESDLSATTASPNPFRFGGKHYLTAASVFLHDFAARFYDAATITFTSHDPLAAKYTQFSPFLYCGADPINYIDPTGCEIVYSTSDPAEIARFKECVKWLQKSPIFDMAYSILSDSFNNYEVNLGLNPDAAEAANFTENKSGLGGVINFKIGVYEFATICEEFFHALQSEFKNGITEKDQNFEFEARVFIAAVDISSPTGVGGTTYPARAAVNNVTELFMDDDNQGLIFDAMFKVGTPEFHSEYINNATVYAKENIKKNYGNQHYKVIPKYGPQILIRLLSMLYFKY